LIEHSLLENLFFVVAPSKQEAEDMVLQKHPEIRAKKED